MAYEVRPAYDGMAKATAVAVVCAVAVAEVVRMDCLGNHRHSGTVKGIYGGPPGNSPKPLWE